MGGHTSFLDRWAEPWSGIGYNGLTYASGACVFFDSAGCVGTVYMNPADAYPSAPYVAGFVNGSTLYTPSNGPTAPVTTASYMCGAPNICGAFPYTSPLVPATATPFPFTLPFHVEVP
jgi:hypothetical protein